MRPIFFNWSVPHLQNTARTPPPEKSFGGICMMIRRLALAVISLTLASTFIQSAQAQSISLSGISKVEKVRLGWSASGSFSGNFLVYRSLNLSHTTFAQFTHFTEVGGGSNFFEFDADRIITQRWGIPIQFMVLRFSGGSLRPSNRVTVTPKPPKVQGLNVASSPTSNTSLVLNWNAIAGGPSGKIYQFDKSANGGTTWDGWTNASNTTTFTVSGLTSGDQYTFRVRAANGSDSSAANFVAGAASDTATGSPLPAAPTGLTATYGDGTVTLNWTGPSATTITNYEYRQSTDGGSNWGAWTDTGSTDATKALTGLTNGTPYTFEVRVVNLGGNSAPSNQATATPSAAPTAPTGLTANASDATVTLSWSAPIGVVDKYQFRQSADGGTNWNPDWVDASGTATSHTVSGLTNGTEYTFEVRAVNSVGNSAASNQATATPSLRPGAPKGLTAVAIQGGATLSWTAAPGTVDNYQYRYRPSAGADWSDVDWIDVSGTNTSVTVTGLTAGTAYIFQVRAENTHGAGAETTSSEVTIPELPVPDAPTGLTAEATAEGARLSWTAVSGTVDKYQYRYRPSAGSDTDWEDWIDVSGTDTSVTVTDLTVGTAYIFQVRAVNEHGESAASESSEVTILEPTTDQPPPDEPTASDELKTATGNSTASVARTMVSSVKSTIGGSHNQPFRFVRLRNEYRRANRVPGTKRKKASSQGRRPCWDGLTKLRIQMPYFRK